MNGRGNECLSQRNCRMEAKTGDRSVSRGETLHAQRMTSSSLFISAAAPPANAILLSSHGDIDSIIS